MIDAPGTSDEQAAECLEYLSYMGQNANDADAALKYGNLALERLRHSPRPSAATEADFIGSLGFAEHLGGHNAQAERDYTQAAADVAPATGRERSAEAISVRNNSGIVSDGAGDSRRALQIFQQTLQIVMQDSGQPQPPPYLVANLARQLENVGRFDEARARYAQCVELAAKSGTAAQSMYCLVGLASVSVSQGDDRAAADYLGKASAIAGGAVPAQFARRPGIAADAGTTGTGARLSRGGAHRTERRDQRSAADCHHGSRPARPLHGTQPTCARDGWMTPAMMPDRHWQSHSCSRAVLRIRTALAWHEENC